SSGQCRRTSSDWPRICRMAIWITITPEDVQFHARDFREHHSRIEPADNCDGVCCQAPGAPHDAITPHWHLVLSAPDLQRDRAVYVEPSGTWSDDDEELHHADRPRNAIPRRDAHDLQAREEGGEIQRSNLFGHGARSR